MGSLRQQVLRTFKQLHNTRKSVFSGDDYALEAGRQKINEEFRKNKHVSDTVAIQELVKYANEVEQELKTTVIQAKEVRPGVYHARIGADVIKLDNVSYKDDKVTQ